MDRYQEETQQVKVEAKHVEAGLGREQARHLIHIEPLLPEPHRRLTFFRALASLTR